MTSTSNLVPDYATLRALRPTGKARNMLAAAVVLGGLLLTGCSGTPASTAPASDAAGGTSTEAAPPATDAAPPTQAAEVPAEPTPEAPAAVPTVGVPFTADLGNGDIARITILTAVRTDTVSTTLGTPATNGSYLLLDVLWETEAGETSSNPFYFSARDAEGRTAELDIFADGQLGSGPVAVGDRARGYIAFDVASGPVTVTITDPLLQEAARIEIPG